jgi:hypothetical protein
MATALTVSNIRLTEVRFRPRLISQSLNADASDRCCQTNENKHQIAGAT